MFYKNLSHPEKWILVGIPSIFIIGSIIHSVYDFTGKIMLIGLIAPVNESIWEHLKLLLLPMIGWWSIYYLRKSGKYKINKDKWFFGLVCALVSSMIIQSAFYYSYTGAFGIESIALDIFDTFLSVTVGQWIGFHKYKYRKGIKAYISISILILLVLVFVIFTFIPPHIPLFKDSNSGLYGI